MTHAATAALSQRTAGADRCPSATDRRSSCRRAAREASRLLEGLRQGQPLGALLGYRVERLLHDTVVDNTRTMDRSSRRWPRGAAHRARQRRDDLAGGHDCREQRGRRPVLHRRWNEDRSAVLAEVTKAGMGTSDLSALTSIFAALADAIDGLSDALTAEAVYQLARGNTSRTASTLAAIAQGDAPPPELEVTRTPRSGTSLTHRLLLLMSGPNVNTPGWLGADALRRPPSDAQLWRSALGDGSKIRCTVERLTMDGRVVETRASL
jgi:hypothetical protein